MQVPTSFKESNKNKTEHSKNDFHFLGKDISPSQRNSPVDKLVEEILYLEDKINQISDSQICKNKSNQELLDNITRDIEKNNSRISLLQKFIEAEEEEINNFIQKKEEERDGINSLIKDLESEILNLKSLSEDGKINSDLFKLLNDDIKNLEKDLYKLQEKKIKLKKDLLEYEMKKDSCKESIIMLREEKNLIESELINLISKKESLEEIINVNNFSFFKGTQNSIDLTLTSVNSLKSIELYYNEINILEKNKLSSCLFETLIEMFTFEISNRYLTTSTSSYANTNNFLLKIDKLSFESLIKRSLDNYREGKGLFNVDDFFYLITKKIYDLLYTSGPENKLFLKELNVEKLRIFLKHFFKVQYYEQVIKTKLNFTNKEYKCIRKDKQLTLSDLESKIINCSKKLDEFEKKEKEMKSSMQELMEQTDENGVKLSALRDCDKKMKQLVDTKTNINIEIYSNKSKNKKRRENYILQIEEIKKINEELSDRKREVEECLENLSLKTKEQIIPIRNKIAEKFQEIKMLIRCKKDNSSNRSSSSTSREDMHFLQDLNKNSEMSEVVSKYIDQINLTFKDNNIDGHISPLKITSVKRIFSKNNSNSKNSSNSQMNSPKKTNPEKSNISHLSNSNFKKISETSRNFVLNQKLEKNHSEDNIASERGSSVAKKSNTSKNFSKNTPGHVRSISQCANELTNKNYIQTDINSNTHKIHSRNNSDYSNSSLFKPKQIKLTESEYKPDKVKMKECIDKIKYQIEEDNWQRDNDGKILEKVSKDNKKLK
jgi:hypothetical protein